jgi:hypothetical protein
MYTSGRDTVRTKFVMDNKLNENNPKIKQITKIINKCTNCKGIEITQILNLLLD